jgi:soluble lytic murein transglycosylase-like protein
MKQLVFSVFIACAAGMAAAQFASAATDSKPTSQEAYREVLQWASGRAQPDYLDKLYGGIERSAYRYGILPEFALAVIGAEAKYGRGISYARQDSWQMYETATKKQLSAYPHVLDDVDTALSELRQIMSTSKTTDAVFKSYWCGSRNQVNADSYGSFSQAASKLWNALEPYAKERMKKDNPAKYGKTSGGGGKGYDANWAALADGDLAGYQSKLGAMPKLASQLKCYPNVESSYATVAKYYNKRLTNAEATVIARSVLTFCDQTQGVVDPRLVMAVIKAESNFKPTAVSRCGALGLGQLMPATARGLGIRDPMDPVQNIYGCVKYLEREMYRWRDNKNALDLVVASYNAGAGAVQRYRGIPPYSETRNYVKIVKKHFSTYTR